ncbi:MAG: hypothetical protein K2X93_23345 [Candidatus Obscuribacterales bacterium]|nr:hypothetical protein [Candidatus Obscuribacterales bacterium]
MMENLLKQPEVDTSAQSWNNEDTDTRMIDTLLQAAEVRLQKRSAAGIADDTLPNNLEFKDITRRPAVFEKHTVEDLMKLADDMKGSRFDKANAELQSKALDRNDEETADKGKLGLVVADSKALYARVLSSSADPADHERVRTISSRMVRLARL